MKSTKKILFNIISFSLLFNSCEIVKEIDYPIEYVEALIVHGFVSRQDGVSVVVKKTLAPNDVAGDDRVFNAVVSLYEDENKIAVLNTVSDNEYLYVSDRSFVPEYNKNYSIRVSAEGFDESSSSKQLLDYETPIDSFKIVINPDMARYRHLVVYYTHSNPIKSAYYFKMSRYINGEKIFNPEWDFFSPFEVFENSVAGSNFIEKRIGVDYEIYDSIRLELFKLSPDLLRYLKSSKNYDTSREDPFYERPYPIYSNIENGFGIFGAYSVFRKTINDIDGLKTLSHK